MRECRRILELIEDTDRRKVAIGAEDLEHTELCHPCRRDWRRYQDYGVLMAQARDALEAEGDLSAQAWSRIRTTAEHRERRAILAWMLQPALGVALVAMLLWIGMATPEPTTHQRLVETHASSAQGTLRAVEPPGAPSPLGPGSVLASHAEPRDLTLFGRHALTLAPRTRATIVAWSPRRLVLNVTAGEVRAVVKRERPDDVFELRTRHARATALGTDYRVAIRLHGVTTVTVDHGAVAVLDNHARTIRVEAGQSLRVGPEGTTSGPTPVSPSAATAPNPQPAAPRPTAPSRRRAPVPGAVESPPSEAAPAPRDYRLKVIEIDVPPQQGPRPGGG